VHHHLQQLERQALALEAQLQAREAHAEVARLQPPMKRCDGCCGGRVSRVLL
jgi:hypothetical protein